MIHGISFLVRVTEASSTTEGYPNPDDPRDGIVYIDLQGSHRVR